MDQGTPAEAVKEVLDTAGLTAAEAQLLQRMADGFIDGWLSKVEAAEIVADLEAGDTIGHAVDEALVRLDAAEGRTVDFIDLLDEMEGKNAAEMEAWLRELEASGKVVRYSRRPPASNR